MKKRNIMLIGAFLITGITSVSANAGTVVVDNDEWTLSDGGYGSAADTGVFVKNVASLFSGGVPGANFHVLSSNFGLNGSSFAATMSSIGDNVAYQVNSNVSLSTLLTYKGVFLAGDAVNNATLIQYVNAGGNVYLAGGTGVVSAAAEAAQWNPLLNAFGLAFAPSYNGVGGNISISSSNPIFAGVTSLYQNNGNDVYTTGTNPNVILL